MEAAGLAGNDHVGDGFAFDHTVACSACQAASVKP